MPQRRSCRSTCTVGYPNKTCGQTSGKHREKMYPGRTRSVPSEEKKHVYGENMHACRCTRRKRDNRHIIKEKYDHRQRGRHHACVCTWSSGRTTSESLYEEKHQHGHNRESKIMCGNTSRAKNGGRLLLRNKKLQTPLLPLSLSAKWGSWYRPCGRRGLRFHCSSHWRGFRGCILMGAQDKRHSSIRGGLQE